MSAEDKTRQAEQSDTGPGFLTRMHSMSLLETSEGPAETKKYMENAMAEIGGRRHQKGHFTRKFTGKCRGPPWPTLCSSLRSRNAFPHVARGISRATFTRHLQEKCRGPHWAQNRGPHFVRA